MRFRRNSPGQTTSTSETSGRSHGRPGSRNLAVAAGAAVALVGTVVGVAAAGVHSGTGVKAGTAGTRQSGTASGKTAAASVQSAGSASPKASSQSHAGGQGQAQGQAQARSRARTTAHSARKALRTSCRSVAHIGDSTSADLISSAYLPSTSQQLGARYAGVGVKHLAMDASGGRSIVEALPGQVNGYNVASAWRSHGYQGCWVFALGTNDTANVAVGSSVGLMARIDRMMSVAHGQPVMWVNTRTLLSTGYWANANQQLWDKTLVRALAKYPSMRIFNWSAVAQPSWFLSDGIHYNSYGCAMRAKAIAAALARAFPLNGHSKGQIVK